MFALQFELEAAEASTADEDPSIDQVSPAVADAVIEEDNDDEHGFSSPAYGQAIEDMEDQDEPMDEHHDQRTRAARAATPYVEPGSPSYEPSSPVGSPRARAARASTPYVEPGSPNYNPSSPVVSPRPGSPYQDSPASPEPAPRPRTVQKKPISLQKMVKKEVSCESFLRTNDLADKWRKQNYTNIFRNRTAEVSLLVWVCAKWVLAQWAAVQPVPATRSLLAMKMMKKMKWQSRPRMVMSYYKLIMTTLKNDMHFLKNHFGRLLFVYVSLMLGYCASK